MKKIFIALFLLLSHNLTNAQSFDITTGKSNSTSAPIAYGTAEDTWQVKLPGSTTFGTPCVSNTTGVSWATNACGRWITTKCALSSPPGAPSMNTPVGLTEYKTTFNVTTPTCVAVTIQFDYLGGDDDIEGLYINGNFYPLTAVPSSDYSPLYQNIAIPISMAHLVAGSNTLIIKVRNNNEYQGLFVCGRILLNYC